MTSHRSVDSLGSAFSVRSIGSAGSILSINSSGRILAIDNEPIDRTRLTLIAAAALTTVALLRRG